jgi:hypothetical protein
MILSNLMICPTFQRDDALPLVQNKLNSCPRNCLDDATPNDIFNAPPPIALTA